MDVKDAIGARRSIRKYEKRAIPPETMKALLESMRLAPSANNSQRWSVIVVTDEGLKTKLVSASGHQKFVGECSAYLVGVIESGGYYDSIDLTIAFDHLTLRAVELGLGTCWIGDFEPDRIKETLGIPKDREVPICMTLGYPAQKPPSRKRKPASQLFHREKWGRSMD